MDRTDEDEKSDKFAQISYHICTFSGDSKLLLDDKKISAWQKNKKVKAKIVLKKPKIAL